MTIKLSSSLSWEHMGVKWIQSFKEEAGIYLGVGERSSVVTRTPGPLRSNRSSKDHSGQWGKLV